MVRVDFKVKDSLYIPSRQHPSDWQQTLDDLRKQFEGRDVSDVGRLIGVGNDENNKLKDRHCKNDVKDETGGNGQSGFPANGNQNTNGGRDVEDEPEEGDDPPFEIESVCR